MLGGAISLDVKLLGFFFDWRSVICESRNWIYNRSKKLSG